MWTLVAILLIIWLIIALLPSVLAVLVWIAISGHKIGAFLGKIFPAYTPPTGP